MQPDTPITPVGEEWPAMGVTLDTPVTQSSYSGYPVQLLQLPNPVTPVTQASYSGYTIQLLWLTNPVTPVTQSRYFGYPIQILRLPNQDTPVTNPVTLVT